MPPFNPYLGYSNYMQQVQPQFQQPQYQQPQMTMPTIHADIIQVPNKDVVDKYPVGVGQSQMFITQDEAIIFVKSATATGNTLEIYDKRPPVPALDPQAYVTREELESRLSALQPRRTRKEEAE